MQGSGVSLAFLMMLGFKEIILIAGVVLALYGRGGARLLKTTRYGRSIDPWVNLVRVRPRAGGPTRPAPAPAPSWRQGRVFWALVVIAAATAAAWVVTRMTVLGGAGVTH